MQEIEQKIQTLLPDSIVTVSGEGCALTATIVSEAFSEKSTVARQQLVYSALQPLIASGLLHAITLKTYTPNEWSKHG